MIRLRDIERYYSQGLRKAWVLNQINLDIAEGEFVTIMGPSGAGKSTLLNIIGMLEDPSGGEYYFYDEPIHKFNERKRSDLHKMHAYRDAIPSAQTSWVVYPGAESAAFFDDGRRGLGTLTDGKLAGVGALSLRPNAGRAAWRAVLVAATARAVVELVKEAG